MSQVIYPNFYGVTIDTNESYPATARPILTPNVTTGFVTSEFIVVTQIVNRP
jgi:hypothetical protein